MIHYYLICWIGSKQRWDRHMWIGDMNYGYRVIANCDHSSFTSRGLRCLVEAREWDQGIRPPPLKGT